MAKTITTGLVRKAMRGGRATTDDEAPEYEDSRGEELDEYATRLAEQLRTLPAGPHRSNVEAELAKAKAKLDEPKTAGIVRWSNAGLTSRPAASGVVNCAV